MRTLQLALVVLKVTVVCCLAQETITNGLVARWVGDGNAKDTAGSADGQVSGGLSYGPGPTGRAFHFNGTDAKIDFGRTVGDFGKQDFTIAYWMKTGSKNSQLAFLSKRTTCDAVGPFWDIRIGGGYSQYPPVGVLHLEMCPGSMKPPYDLFSSHPLNDGQWHHVAWVRQSTSSGTITCLIYVDGVLDNSKTYPEMVDLTSQSPLVLGQSVCQGFDGSTPYDGGVGELQIFSRAVGEEEVLAIFRSGNAKLLSK